MLNRHKNWLVHKQTACGKDFSNPFMVDNLPKIVGFSTHLASLVKSWLVQDQTVLGKDYSNLLIADSLLKTIWFINAPCYGNEALASPKANELTIPEQTATGKGTSNPFMAGSLPKTTKPTLVMKRFEDNTPEGLGLLELAGNVWKLWSLPVQMDARSDVESTMHLEISKVYQVTGRRMKKGGLLGIMDFYNLVLLIQLDTAGDG
ncbi:hypothetical protein Tco_1282423 [Tanacetum coccineum]